MRRAQIVNAPKDDAIRPLEGTSGTRRDRADQPFQFGDVASKIIDFALDPLERMVILTDG